MKVRVIIGLSLMIATGACSEEKPAAVINLCGPTPSDTDGDARAPAAKDVAKDATRRDVGAIVHEVSWQLCNARTNHWIDDDYFRRELTALREGALAVYGGPAPTKSTIKNDDLAICLTAAGDDAARQAACQK